MANNRNSNTINENMEERVYQWDLDSLKEFNPALAYGFDPESSGNSSSLVEAFHLVGQYLDVFDAYRFAQDNILPEIKKTGIQNITGQQILLWLDEIHKRIAGTLARNANTLSGKYAEKQVLRWVDIQIKDLVLEFFSGMFSERDLYKKCSKLGFDSKKLKAFVRLLKKIDGVNVDFPESFKINLDPDSPFAKGICLFAKLSILYHSGFLTAPEKETVHNVVKICMLPENIQEAMATYAENLAAELKKVDPANLNEVVKLLSEAFYQLTEIHPYFNGNGRAATCWMNILLRGMGYPSILMRYPQERFDPNSTYSKAIEHLDTNLNFMIEHLKKRIQEVQTGNFFKDDELKELVCVRIRIVKILKEIQKKLNCSMQTLDEIYMEVNQKTFQKILSSKKHKFDPDNAQETYTNAFSLDINKETLVKLESMLVQKSEMQVALHALSINQPKYDSKAKTQAVEKLKEIVGRQGEWKAYVSKDEKVVVHLNLNTKQEAENVFQDAKGKIDQSIVKLGIGTNPKINKETVSFEILHFNNLMNIGIDGPGMTNSNV